MNPDQPTSENDAGRAEKHVDLHEFAAFDGILKRNFRSVANVRSHVFRGSLQAIREGSVLSNGRNIRYY